jgi:hypothetical protein
MLKLCLEPTILGYVAPEQGYKNRDSTLNRWEDFANRIVESNRES